MSDFKLFGSGTSPYVRRVRIVAAELGLTADWTDSMTPDGQAALRAFNPLWKVPAAEVGTDKLFESAVINQALLRRFGPGPLAVFDPTDLAAVTTLNVIDGALDSLINAFYLVREKVDPSTPYVIKQKARAQAALSWLEQRVNGRWVTKTEAFGLPEISLISALDWMVLRQVYDVSQHPGLLACVEPHRERSSVAATMPG